MYTTKLTKRQCCDLLRRNLDFFPSPFSGEQYAGWCKWGFFSVVYHHENTLFKRMNPIYSRVCGYMRGKGGGARVRYMHFYGLTDPFSLMKLFLGSLVIFWAVYHGYGASFGMCAMFSVIWCVIVSALTFIASFLSATCAENRRALEEFMHSLLELKS